MSVYSDVADSRWNEDSSFLSVFGSYDVPYTLNDTSDIWETTREVANFIDFTHENSNTTTVNSFLTMLESPAPTISSHGYKAPEVEDIHWKGILSRSRAMDKSFLYVVLTTKIYCRPSCASRRAMRRNIRTFPVPGAIEAARQAGFRPCKRCKPDTLGLSDANVQNICQITRTIIAEASDICASKPCSTLGELAAGAGLSRFHFQRLFKATAQMKPGDFIIATHALALQDALGLDSAVRRTIQTGAGPAGVSLDPARWSQRAARRALGGMTPRVYATGAVDTAIQYCVIDSPVGNLCMTLSANGRVNALLHGADAEDRIRTRFPHSRLGVHSRIRCDSVYCN